MPKLAILFELRDDEEERGVHLTREGLGLWANGERFGEIPTCSLYPSGCCPTAEIPECSRSWSQTRLIQRLEQELRPRFPDELPSFRWFIEEDVPMQRVVGLLSASNLLESNTRHQDMCPHETVDPEL